ncbi:MAG: hypothetical protein KAS49_06535 [Candidatus Cloacimonetes bacterium]|nr:hypothetical protein [Candidatus Cloacimonadota bacterium]
MDNRQNQQPENEYLKFDKRVLLISLNQKIFFIFGVAFIATILGFFFAKMIISDTWESQCVMIRHKKNLRSQTTVPYLYSEMDYNTILQSIKTRKNLQSVIDSLKLKLTPEQIYGTIKVTRRSRSNLVNVKAQHKDRRVAVDIANTLAEVFMQSYIEILNSSTNKIYQYYHNQKLLYNVKKEEIGNKLANFRSDNKILSLEKEIQNKYDNLKILELDLMNLQMLISSLSTKSEDIAARIEQLPEKVELSSIVSGSKEKQLKFLKNELEVLQKKYTDKNPKILKLKSEIKQLEQSLLKTSHEEQIPDSKTFGKNSLRESLILERTRYENELISSIKRISELENKIANIKEQLKVLSPIEREYYDIINEKETIQEHLMKVKDRENEAKIAMESNLSDFEILEPAIAPKYPISSGRKIVALVVGFLAFVGLIIFYSVKEFVDFSVKSKYDFSEVIKIKMLEEIPNKDNVPPSVFYSKMQILYGQLCGYLNSSKSSVIAIGKDTFATGATFIIQELAELALSQNKKIMWIESVSESNDEIAAFEINNRLYEENSDLPKIYELTDKLHISYFVCNETTFKKVLSKEKIDGFLAELSDYDLIFWEMFSVDYNLQLFNIIASSADLLAFVVRFRHSNRFKLLNAVKFLKENNDVPIVGVLNNSKKPYFKQ